MLKNFYPVFFLEYYGITSYIYDWFRVNICDCFMIVVQFDCSAAWSSFLKTTDWRDCPFPIRCSWLQSQIFLPYLYGFILDSLFCSTGLCVYFYSRTILLLLICGVCLNQVVWISNFVLPQNYFGYSGSFVIHTDLGLLFLFLWKFPLEFERDGIKTLRVDLYL